tara:strand:- start:2504 stop:3043 length:540 start_codon:yes stop_codon:yes gene_type:complete
MTRGYANTTLETPEYELIRKDGQFEIRQYKPMIVAGTIVQTGYKKATYTGFRRIANYIFGGNEKTLEIAMTAPVISNSPVDVESAYEVIFIMPSAYTLDDLLEPNNSNVELSQRDLGRVASIVFGGWATETRAEYFHNRLMEWLGDQQLNPDGKYMVAQYNSPWMLPPFRKNEILVRIK